ncbi:MAG: NAD(P)H-dependent glycerol-3-phosphate dehydrogenase [Pseudomonadota bacterium]
MTRISDRARTPVAVLGAGSYGTSLAIQYARTGTPVLLWGRNATAIGAMASARENECYLPGATFPDGIEPVTDLADALGRCDEALVVVPSHALRQTLEAMKVTGRCPERVSWATKGLELETGKLPHEVVGEVLGDGGQHAVLSGPTFAAELGRGLPTALTVASDDEAYATSIAERITDGAFRAYTSGDIVGVEVGGATKNVMAIGAGISDGLGFGSNARVALVTRGLSEMMRFGLARGALAETFMGLAGMGDLVLTCTDNQSRNRRMGLALASGKTVAEAEAEIQQVVEGVLAARAVHKVAQDMDVDMPITEQIFRVLYEGVTPNDAVRALFQRATGAEFSPG